MVLAALSAVALLLAVWQRLPDVAPGAESALQAPALFAAPGHAQIHRLPEPGGRVADLSGHDACLPPRAALPQTGFCRRIVMPAGGAGLRSRRLSAHRARGPPQTAFPTL